MENFNQLNYSLMIGTANGASLSETVKQELSQLGIIFNPNFAQQEPAVQLLTAAAAYAPLTQAAILPATSQIDETQILAQNNEPATAIYCSEEQIHALIFILKDHHEEILGEFIRYFDNKKYNLPDWIIPDLLNFGLQHSHLQPALAELLGQKGLWLAKFRPDWGYIRAYFMDTSDSKLFEYGSETQRLAWFAQLRREQPTAAFELVQTHWQNEKTEIKAKLLACLRANFHPDEEPFLLAQLQDRRKEVREAALSVLEKNYTGEWQKMLVKIAQSWLQIETKTTQSQPVLQLNLPEQHSAELAQVGIKANLHQLEGGEKASWLLQLFSKLLPDNLLTINPLIDINNHLQLFLKSDWKRPLLCGLWTAARHFEAQNWLYELHKLYLETYTQTYWQSCPTEQLPAGLDAAHLQKVANLYLLDAEKAFSDTHPLINLLTNSPHWNAHISRKVLILIDKHSSKENFSLYYGLKALLQRAAYAVDADIYPFARELWEQPSEHKAYNWIKDFRQFLSILQIRHFLRLGS